MWVSDGLARASKTGDRSSAELRVRNVEPVVADAASAYEQMGIDLGVLPPGGYERRYIDPWTEGRLKLSSPTTRGGSSVGGRPVNP